MTPSLQVSGVQDGSAEASSKPSSLSDSSSAAALLLASIAATAVPPPGRARECSFEEIWPALQAGMNWFSLPICHTALLIRAMASEFLERGGEGLEEVLVRASAFHHDHASGPLRFDTKEMGVQFVVEVSTLSPPSLTSHPLSQSSPASLVYEKVDNPIAFPEKIALTSSQHLAWLWTDGFVARLIGQAERGLGGCPPCAVAITAAALLALASECARWEGRGCFIEVPCDPSSTRTVYWHGGFKSLG